MFFPVGTSGAPATLDIIFDITDDDVFEKDHSFLVDIISAEDNVNIALLNDRADVTIIDNDGMQRIAK